MTGRVSIKSNLIPTRKKISGFAWGGGQEDDGSGGNISPQFPGWINFNVGGTGGPSGDGTGTCFDNILNLDGGETDVDTGGRCGGGPVGGDGLGTCFDNIQNIDSSETAPDFGGRCGTSGPAGDGTGTCFDNILNLNSSETDVDIGGRCSLGVVMCDTPTCGATLPAGTAICSRNPFPVINTNVVWRVSPSKSDCPACTYSWTVTPPSNIPPPTYTITGNDTDSMTVVYNKKGTGEWITDVLVNPNDGNPTFKCQNTSITKYEVRDSGLDVIITGSMTTQFVRSIRSITFPDVTISISAFGGFADPVLVRFKEIIGPFGDVKGGLPGTSRALIVEPQFWTATRPGPFSTITLGGGRW